MKKENVKLPKVKIIDEFKAFAMKGNMVDMAVGIIIGAAFGKIVTSLVNDIIMPPIGLLVGGVNFTDLTWVMKDAVDGQPAVTWNYGNFVQVIIDFLIVAWAVFMMVKAISMAKRKDDVTSVAPQAPTKEEALLTEIRDLLRQSDEKKG